MASQNNKILVRNPITQKTFSYTRGQVSMNFTLRTDIKEELVAGLEISEALVKDIKEELAKKKQK